MTSLNFVNITVSSLILLNLSFSQTNVGGIISSDTTWTKDKSPYSLVSNVQIAPSVTLTVDSGVVIDGNNFSIESFGTFSAQGIAGSKVNIVNTNLKTGSNSTNSSAMLNLDFCVIENGNLDLWVPGMGTGGLRLTNSVLKRVNNGGDPNIETNLYISYPTLPCLIEKNIFIECGGISTRTNAWSIGTIDIRNNIFYKQSTNYAVKNEACTNSTPTTIVRKNTFLSTDRVAIDIEAGNSLAKIIADSNYWSTTSDSLIELMITDRHDDLNRASYVTYTPILTDPDSLTPIYPEASVNYSKIIFPATAINDTSVLTFYLVSGPISDVHIFSIQNNRPEILIDTNQLKLIPRNDSVQVSCKFIPTQYGKVEDTLEISTEVGVLSIIINGDSPFPYLMTNLLNVDFGSVLKGGQNIINLVMKDSSVNLLSIDSLITGTEYFVVFKTPANKYIKTDDSLIMSITFSSNSVGQYKDTLSIYNSSPINPVRIPLYASSVLTSVVNDKKPLPDLYSLNQNFPNPFNPTTSIQFGVPQDSKVKIVIYNVIGQQVMELINQEMNAGYHQVTWNPRVASGIYFYRIEATSISKPYLKFVDIKKMSFIK